MQDTNSIPDPRLTQPINLLAQNQFAMALEQMRRLTATPPPTPSPSPTSPTLDSGDPVAQALQLMHSEENLPPTAPAHDAIPAEAHVQNLISNFTNNTRAWGGHGIAGQALGALLDPSEAAQNAVYSAMGTNQADMNQRFDQLAERVPAPSTTQLLQMGLAGMGAPQGTDPFILQMLKGEDTGRRWSPETAEIAGSILTDPTTYIGAGLFKGLARGAAKVGAPKLAVRGLATAAAGDAAISDMMGKAAEGLIRFTQVAGLSLPNKALGAMFPELPKWTAYAKTESAMGDALQWLEHKGWDLPALRSTGASGSLDDVMEQFPTEVRAEVDPAHLDRVINGAPANDISAAYTNYQRWLRSNTNPV
jgi:hypothetical protein